MYTNGLKDRFGSPLVSERDLDNLVMFPMDEMLGRITSTEANLEDVNYNIDGINTDLNTVTKDLFNLKNKIGDNDYVTENKLNEIINSGSSVNGIDRLILDTFKKPYSTYINTVFTSEGMSNAYLSSFRFGYKHLPRGVIKKISVLARDTSNQTHDSKTNGCFLLAKIYKKDGTLVRSYCSTNKLVVVEKALNATERPKNTWFFDGIITPNKDEVLKFIPSPDGIKQVASYYIGACVDTTHNHIDCRTGGDDDFANNPLGTGNKYMVYAEYEGDFYTDTEKNKCVEPHEQRFLKSLYTVTQGVAFDNNINNESLGAGFCVAAVLERPYIGNGTFNKIGWNSSGTSSSNCHLKITLRDVTGSPIASYMSSNKQSFSSAGDKLFEFDEFTVDDNVGSILFETSTDGVSVSNSAVLRVKIIGNTLKPEADGSEIVGYSFVINVKFYGKVATANDNILSKSRADSLYAPISGVITTQYDWTPDYTNNIKLDVHEYTFPVNGWLVSRDWQYLVELQNEIRIDDKPVGQVNDKGNFSILCKKDEVLTIENGLDVPFWFFPCKSEQYDYRVTHTQYDIWRGAVTTDGNGNTVVQNMHCPDASGWNNAVGNALLITKVEDEVAYNGDTFVCNIQSSEIVNGEYLMAYHRELETWNSDLQRLENGHQMFHYCDALASFSPDLPSLTDGRQMFYNCYNIKSFSSDLPSLTNGDNMFTGCSFTTFSSDLPNLTDGTAMFYYCSNLKSFSTDLPNLTNGCCMFVNCSALTSFSSDLPNLTDGTVMFDGCSNLASFTSDLPSLEDGERMFQYCTKLESFSSDLSSLTDGQRMFFHCDNLTSFSSDLPNLTNGDNMFYGTNLKQFDIDLQKLEDGSFMFMGCYNLTAFTSDLSSLTNGYEMFKYCNALASFSSDLPSLTSGENMFRGCSLDAQSVERILTTIPDYGTEYTKRLAITMNISACPKASEIVGLVSGQIIPQHPSQIAVRYKGWGCYLSCANGSYTVPSATSEYDVVEGSDYIPDASSWYNVREDSGLVITRVENGKAYNDNN